MSTTTTNKNYAMSWIILLASLTALGPLSIDMYLSALPQMADDFGVTTQQVANSLPAYFLGLAIGQLVYGPVSDRIGRKPPLYFGLALYVVASLLCVFAQNEWSLIAARVLQALGGCVGVVIARAAIRDRLDMHSAAQAFASMMIVSTIAPILAPSMGAWVLLVFEWNMIFVLLMLFGLVILACVHFFFKETLEPERRLQLSFTQPWKVYVLTGKKRDELVEKVCQAQMEIYQNPKLAEQYKETFSYYPEQWLSPFIDRRRENGWGLYGLLNIQKGEKEKMARQQLRNFQLFDAPVGLFFTVHKSLGIGSKMDISMMIQNVMLAAKARGLDTCPQAAWNHFHPIVLDVVGAPEDEELVCGMALGYADPEDIVNTFITPRVPVEDFAVFLND
jgi:multidrug resistance protein